MSLAADCLAVAAPALLAQHGDTVTYTPPDGGAAVELQAMFVGDEESQDKDDRGKIQLTRLTATLPRTAAAAGGGNYVADPSPRATITYGGVVYAISLDRDAIALNPAFAAVHLVRKVFTKRNNPDYQK